jgi:hypothetical protein
MPWVSFEPTIPVFERAETFHVSDRAATVIGLFIHREYIINVWDFSFLQRWLWMWMASGMWRRLVQYVVHIRVLRRNLLCKSLYIIVIIFLSTQHYFQQVELAVYELLERVLCWDKCNKYRWLLIIVGVSVAYNFQIINNKIQLLTFQERRACWSCVVFCSIDSTGNKNFLNYNSIISFNLLLPVWKL